MAQWWYRWPLTILALLVGFMLEACTDRYTSVTEAVIKTSKFVRGGFFARPWYIAVSWLFKWFFFFMYSFVPNQQQFLQFAFRVFALHCTAWRGVALHCIVSDQIELDRIGSQFMYLVFYFGMACLYIGEIVFVAFVGIKKGPQQGVVAIALVFITLLWHIQVFSFALRERCIIMIFGVRSRVLGLTLLHCTIHGIIRRFSCLVMHCCHVRSSTTPVLDVCCWVVCVCVCLGYVLVVLFLVFCAH